MVAGSDAHAGCLPSESIPEGASNVLVLAPAMDEGADELCTDLLTPTSADRLDLLSVTLDRSPDRRLDTLRHSVGGGLPAKMSVVGCDETRCSAASAGSKTINLPSPDNELSLTTISEPGDLTGLGIEVSERLQEWSGDGNQTVICFHSLSTLLHYSDLESVFRFLHVLTKRVDAAGAVAHFHMDPGAHDDRTVAAIKSLLDAVYERSGDSWDLLC